MSEKIKSFRDLRIWQSGMDLVEDVYKSLLGFPKYEIYGLAGQMRRAAISIPSNIAEGFRRIHPKEYRHFLRIALGSCSGLETHCEIAKRLGYLSSDQSDVFINKLDFLCRMIVSLIKKV